MRRRRPRTGAEDFNGWSLWRVLPRALPYLKPYWKLGALSFVLLILASIATLAQPWPLATMLDVVSGKETKADFLFFGEKDKFSILLITAIAGFLVVVV
jgi:ABC-type multidrug transport system fused ATPase/permease subunit